MQDDPVVAEVRRIREELAARFNYDIHAICEHARQQDAASGDKVIRLPPRRPEGYQAKTEQSTNAPSGATSMTVATLAQTIKRLSSTEQTQLFDKLGSALEDYLLAKTAEGRYEKLSN